LGFHERRSKNDQIANFTKIRTVGAQSFHADRRSDGWTHEWTRRSKLSFFAIFWTRLRSKDTRLRYWNLVVFVFGIIISAHL